MGKDLKVELNGDQKVLEIREGAALPLHELKTLSIIGSLKSPGDFLDIRKEQFPVNATHVLVNKNQGVITINSQDREDVGKICIVGKLNPHPDFISTGINDPECVRSTNELANWIKMNRTFFESKTKAMELVSVLRNFKVTVNKQIEDKSDDRANYDKIRQQTVESNIPEAFKVKCPLFVGGSVETFEVEVVIDPEDFSCALISPDAADMIKNQKDERIDQEVNRFVGYAIIYQ